MDIKKSLEVGLMTVAISSMGYSPLMINEVYADNLSSISQEDIKTGTIGDCDWRFNTTTGTLVLKGGVLGTNKMPWNQDGALGDTVKHIVISGKVILPSDSSNLFSDSSLISLEGANNLDTSNVTNMSNMFLGDDKLETLDLNGWDTSNVTKMNGMFAYTRVLGTVNMDGFNTSNVTSMRDLFSNSGIKYVDLSSFDTSEVSDMGNMFLETPNLTKLNLQNFNTKNAINFSGMLYHTSIAYLKLGPNTNLIDPWLENPIVGRINPLTGTKSNGSWQEDGTKNDLLDLKNPKENTVYIWGTQNPVISSSSSESTSISGNDTSSSAASKPDNNNSSSTSTGNSAVSSSTNSSSSSSNNDTDDSSVGSSSVDKPSSSSSSSNNDTDDSSVSSSSVDKPSSSSSSSNNDTDDSSVSSSSVDKPNSSSSSSNNDTDDSSVGSSSVDKPSSSSNSTSNTSSITDLHHSALVASQSNHLIVTNSTNNSGQLSVVRTANEDVSKAHKVVSLPKTAAQIINNVQNHKVIYGVLAGILILIGVTKTLIHKHRENE